MKFIYFLLFLFFTFNALAQKTFNVASGDWGVSGNWSPSGIPTASDDVIIPTATVCNFGDAEGNRFCNSFTIATGGQLNYTTNVATSHLSVSGDFTVAGVLNHPGNIAFGLKGGTSGAYKSLIITGSLIDFFVSIGKNYSAYYKLMSDAYFWGLSMDNVYACGFDMNGYNFYQKDFTVKSGVTFKQGSGLLQIERNSTIDNTSFQEQTGTTYFGSGIYFPAVNQTIPSISYYKVKARTNSGYTVTLGSAATITIANDIEIVTGTTGGSVVMANNNTNVTGNLSIANGSTLNLVGTNAKALTIGGTSITNSGTINGYNSGNYELIATNSVTLDGNGTWDTEAQFQKNLTIANGKTITINSGYFRLGSTHNWFLTNNGTITGSTGLYHITIDKNYTISGTGTYASINIGLGDKVTATLGNNIVMTGSLKINDADPDLLDVAGYNITIGTSFINNGTFAGGVKKVTFDGAATATIEGTSTTTFYDLELNKTASTNTVTNASGQMALQVSNDLTITSGTLSLGATNAHYVVSGDLTVAATNGILNHTVNASNITTSKYLNVIGNVDISGTYTTSGNTPHFHCSGAGSKTIKCPNSAFKYLTFKDGTYTANGNLSADTQFWAMWNTAAGEFHTNGNTITSNGAFNIDGGTLYVDGGTLSVTAGGLWVGKTDRNGILSITSGTLSCNEFNNGDGTFLGTTTFTGGTLDVNGNIILNSSTTFSTSNAPAMFVSGDWVNKGGTYSPSQTVVTFDGAAEQKINVTTAGGTTPYDSDFTFYDITIANSHANGVKLYYKSSTSRLVNINNVVINNPSKLSIVEN